MADENLADIVTQVGVAARQFKAVIALADAIDSVAKLDQLYGEAQQRVARGRQEEADMQAALDALNKRLDALNAEIDRAKVKGDEIVAEAMRQAGEIKRKADAEILAAKDANDRAMAEAAAQASARLAAIEATIAESAKEADEAKDAAVAARAELAAVNTQLDEARASIKKLLGV